MKNGASWLERLISMKLYVKDIPETLRNINLSSQLAQYAMDILTDIPGNIPMSAKALGCSLT